MTPTDREREPRNSVERLLLVSGRRHRWRDKDMLNMFNNCLQVRYNDDYAALGAMTA